MARKRLADVLSPEQLEAWRREGLTCDEIGKRVGFSGKTVSAYGRKILPKDLLGKGRRGKKPRKTKEDRDLEFVRGELRRARAEAETRKRKELAQEAREREEAGHPAVTKLETRVVKERTPAREGTVVTVSDGNGALVQATLADGAGEVDLRLGAVMVSIRR